MTIILNKKIKQIKDILIHKSNEISKEKNKDNCEQITNLISKIPKITIKIIYLDFIKFQNSEIFFSLVQLINHFYRKTFI